MDIPCIKQIDRTLADSMKDPDGMCTHIFPDPDFPVVKGVNRHEAGWVSTEFCIICVLGDVRSVMTACEADECYPCWNQ